MAGLLSPDEQSQINNDALMGLGMGLLSASGPSRVPVSLGQALGQGMQGMQQSRSHAEQMAMKKRQMEQEAQHNAMLNEMNQMKLAGMRNDIQAQESAKQNLINYLGQMPDGPQKEQIKSAMMMGVPMNKVWEKVNNTEVTKWGVSPIKTDKGYVQLSDTGGMRELPYGLPPELRYIPGDDYRAGGVVDLRSASRTGGNANPPLQAPEVAPHDPMAPWNTLPPKAADQMRVRLYTSESKKLDDMREQVTKGSQVLQDLERFGQLNRDQGTGGILDRTPLPSFDSQKREMEAIAARLAPNVRPVGAGATSDRDIALYLQGLPGIDKGGDVNKSIRDQYSKNYTEAQKKLSFAEKYLAEKGHLNGWQSAYEGTNKETPVNSSIPKDAINMLRMNPKLREHFDAKYGAGSADSVLGR